MAETIQRILSEERVKELEAKGKAEILPYADDKRFFCVIEDNIYYHRFSCVTKNNIYQYTTWQYELLKEAKPHIEATANKPYPV